MAPWERVDEDMTRLHLYQYCTVQFTGNPLHSTLPARQRPGMKRDWSVAWSGARHQLENCSNDTWSQGLRPCIIRAERSYPPTMFAFSPTGAPNHFCAVVLPINPLIYLRIFQTRRAQRLYLPP